MSTTSHRQELVRYWWGKAQESLESASSEIDAGRLAFAVNRLYYAVFYAVTTALAAKGQKLGKHSAVRSAYHRDFIKTGEMETAFGRLYDELFHARHQGDYTPLIEFEDHIVRQQAEDVQRFLKALQPKIREYLV